jgi:hypothetical protein
MNSGHAVVLAIAALAVVAIAFGIFSRRRDQKLRKHFGEYDGAVRRRTDLRKRQEAVLAFRRGRQRVGLRTLTSAERATFLRRWDELQNSFLDDPKGSLDAADALVTEALEGRGYLMPESQQNAADIPPNSSLVVEDYRAVHEFATRLVGESASTEQLRQAMVRYRTVFRELLTDQGQTRRSA